jgi:hypothetical protein
LDTAIRKDDGNHFYYTGVNEAGEKCRADIISISLDFDKVRGIILNYKDYSVAMRLVPDD